MTGPARHRKLAISKRVKNSSLVFTLVVRDGLLGSEPHVWRKNSLFITHSEAEQERDAVPIP